MQVTGGIFKGSSGGLLYGHHMLLGMSDKRCPRKCSLWEMFFGEICFMEQRNWVFEIDPIETERLKVEERGKNRSQIVKKVQKPTA